MRLCEKYFAAFAGKMKFFGAPFSLILLRKISENGAPKKYYSAAQAAELKVFRRLRR